MTKTKDASREVTSVRLTAAERELLRKLGGGNASRGIREALKLAADTRHDSGMTMTRQ